MDLVLDEEMGLVLDEEMDLVLDEEMDLVLDEEMDLVLYEEMGLDCMHIFLEYDRSSNTVSVCVNLWLPSEFSIPNYCIK